MNERFDCILGFLEAVAAHNDRAWFAAHRAWYEEARGFFEEMVQQLLLRIAAFDESVAHLSVGDCTYRFYRDTRFSPDKSPYKRHFGAYVNACGKKSWHSGYYFHLEPGNCMLAGGSWCLPAPVLKAVRRAVVDEIEEFRSIVEDETFRRTFPVIGETHLKTLPKGFSKDFPYPDYLRPKDYSISHHVEDGFFHRGDWLDRTEDVFRLMKPFNDFVNYTIDECEGTL